MKIKQLFKEQLLTESTRSFIAIKDGDNKYRGIYCHWDGYPTGNGVGQMLKKHWRKISKINDLMKLGSLSSLGKEVGKKHDFGLHYSKPDHKDFKDWCLSHGRDRGDKDSKMQTFNSMERLLRGADSMDAAYLYIYDTKEKKWFYMGTAEERLMEL